MKRQTHDLFTHEAGTAVHSPGAPWWVKLHDPANAGSFFDAFMKGTARDAGRQFQWVTEEAVARAFMTAHADAVHSVREMVAYYLPAEAALPAPCGEGGALRQPLLDDYIFLFAGVEAFYREALGVAPPRDKEGGARDAAAERPTLYVWATAAGAPPVAMGVLTPTASYGDTLRTRRLNLIYVPKENRRAGYGRAVVTALCEIVRAEGSVPILYAYGDNTAAQRLYEGLGFVTVGRVVEMTM